VGQGTPGAAVAIAIDDGVEDAAEVILAWPAEGPGLGKQGFEDGPLGVGQIARVR